MTYDQMIKQLERMTLRFEELEQQGIFEEPKITKRAQYIIEESIELIEQNRFNELFDRCFSDVQVEVAKALLTAGFDLEKHLHPVPPALKKLFNKNTDNNVKYHIDIEHYKQVARSLDNVTAMTIDTSKTWKNAPAWLQEVESYG